MSHDFPKAQSITAPYSPAPSHFSQSSMADQNSQQSRQQSTSYPSPHSYPSPSMQPTYTYPPPQGQSNPEPYRGSPQGSNMSLPSLNLPPIRVPDGQAQAPPQPQPGQHSSLPPQHPIPQYYPHPGHPPPPGQPMNITSTPHNLAMRYQLPPQGGEQRILSGGRHKKEIKRRTKTGCLTCRKRRIKCDEAHPICRNCQKSKRECLGYDPIFKQQQGPAQIQPAPNSAPLQTSAPASTPPTTVPYGSQVPQGYAPAVSAGYAPPATAAAAGSGHTPYENFNNSAIDPALAATDPGMHGGQPPYNGAPAINSALRRIESASPYSSAASDAQPTKANRIKITDLFSIGGHHPPEIPPRPTPIPAELDDEFTKIFTNDYCQGLDDILESKWFSTNGNALKRILGDKSVHEEAIYFTETIKYHQSSYDSMARIPSQEARLIWHLLGVCRQTPPATNGTNGTSPANAENEDILLKETRARFGILESLLTNQNLETNPARQLTYAADISAFKRAEVDFWEQLGNFVVYADSESAPPGAVDQALGIMRNVLQTIEARDVIYSIAIARHVGARVPGFPNRLPPPVDQNPETNANKLAVAMGFIGHESRASRQQVISRICEMATISWAVARAP